MHYSTKMMNGTHSKRENMVYLIFWAILFIAPIVSIQFHHGENRAFPWEELFSVWKELGIIFLLFLTHNFLLAPLLVYKQHRLAYFSSVAVLTGCFVVMQCAQRPAFNEHHDFQWEERHHPEFHEPHPPKPPLIFGQHDLVSSIMLILLLGMNIGVKLYFKQRDDEQRMEKLEKENLQQQLEYLRYQINPHFLMNTLNNIHALVDIDSERAKETIVELSKIMRFALYEGSHSTVPLGRDVAFLESYIHLMRLRYTDKVNITVDISQQLPDSNIPPMLFITFVENAFKHGISYQQTSFINISLQTKDHHLLFSCQNSKPQQPQKNEEGGVGLKNVQRRLQLLYGDNFTLTISNQPDTYNIRLVIPL